MGEVGVVRQWLAKVPSRSARLWIIALIALPLILGVYRFASNSSTSDIAKIQGKVALTEQELTDVVRAKHLIIYWAGPLDGARYALIATTPGLAYLRYLPGGVGLNDTKTLFRVVGTYIVKNGFAVTQTTGAIAGNVGFTNADGNSVFYSNSRPTNIYIGVKGRDLQVEIFDPSPDIALAFVTAPNQMRQIG
jgi:hypothetical protein